MLPQHRWCSSFQQGMLQKYGEKNKNETDKSVLPPFVYGRRHCLTTVFKHKLLVDQKTLNISNHDDDDDDVDDDGGGDDDDDAGGRGGGGSQNRLILHPIQYTADLFYTRQGSLLWIDSCEASQVGLERLYLQNSNLSFRDLRFRAWFSYQQPLEVPPPKKKSGAPGFPGSLPRLSEFRRIFCDPKCSISGSILHPRFWSVLVWCLVSHASNHLENTSTFLHFSDSRDVIGTPWVLLGYMGRAPWSYKLVCGFSLLKHICKDRPERWTHLIPSWPQDAHPRSKRGTIFFQKSILYMSYYMSINTHLILYET